MIATEAYRIIGILFTTYPQAKLSLKNAEAYVSALLDLPADATARAIDRLRRTKTFLPSVAEIRNEVANVVLGPKRSGEDAYRVVLEAIRRFGRYEVPKFRDPHITRAMGVWGGWVQCCDSPDDDPGGRARFCELYEQCVNREREDIVSGIPLPAPRDAKSEFILPEKTKRAKRG